MLIGIFGTAITVALTAFPKELIAAIAGLALLGTIGAALSTALRDDFHREAALITFLVTLSGVVIAGVGAVTAKMGVCGETSGPGLATWIG